MHYTPVDRLRGRGHVGVGGREVETLMEGNGEPRTLEALSLQALAVGLRIVMMCEAPQRLVPARRAEGLKMRSRSVLLSVVLRSSEKASNPCY